MSTKKKSSKNAITAGVLITLYLVTYVVIGAISMPIPILFLLMPMLVALFAAPTYHMLLAKTKSSTAIFIAAVDVAELDKKLQDFAAAHKVSANLKENGDAFEVTVIGKSAHNKCIINHSNIGFLRLFYSTIYFPFIQVYKIIVYLRKHL